MTPGCAVWLAVVFLACWVPFGLGLAGYGWWAILGSGGGVALLIVGTVVYLAVAP